MSAVPAARYLTDFTTDDDVRPLPALNRPLDADAAASAKLDEAFARGLETGRTTAEAEFKAKAEALQREFAARLAAERQEWATQVGEELANRMVLAVADLENRIAGATARILKPFLSAELHRQAMAELKASLDALLTTDSGVGISISGPADVLEALQQQLAGRAAEFSYTISADCDVRIVAGPTTLETRLKSWLAKLDEAVP